MPVINPGSHKFILKHGGAATGFNTIGSAWMADLTAFLLTNPNFSIFDIHIGNISPEDTTRLWFDPAGTNTAQSEQAQGQLKIYIEGEWINCTPAHFARWLVYRVPAKPEYTEALTPPTPNVVGHIWKNTDDETVSGILPNTKGIWTGVAWVQVRDDPIALPEYSETTTAPTPNVIGHIWKNVSNNVVSGIFPSTKGIWTGVSWVQLRDDGGAGGGSGGTVSDFFKNHY